MIFIGDVHGKYRAYKRIIKQCGGSIQVGDLGVGFRHVGGPRADMQKENPPYDLMVAGEHRFISGNHDNPGVCRGHSQCIQHGHIENGIMFIGGAESIDRHLRVEGYSWWPDEELSIAEFDRLIGLYTQAKPKVMVTHDCPAEIAEVLIGKYVLMHSRTRQALQVMLSAHSPKLWIFGHHHQSFDQIAQGTRFICLNELEARDIEIPQ